MTTWPLRELIVTGNDCQLRYPTEAELYVLADAASSGLELDNNSFLSDWTKPRETFADDFLRYHWLQRASWEAKRWSLEMAICAPEPVGIVKLEAEFFHQVGIITSGSWLLPSARGRGIGREARRLGLALAQTIGANSVQCYIHPDNRASHRVSESLGYTAVGERWVPNAQQQPQREIHYMIDSGDIDTDGITVVGFDAAARMFEPSKLPTN